MKQAVPTTSQKDEKELQPEDQLSKFLFPSPYGNFFSVRSMKPDFPSSTSINLDSDTSSVSCIRGSEVNKCVEKIKEGSEWISAKEAFNDDSGILKKRVSISEFSFSDSIFLDSDCQRTEVNEYMSNNEKLDDDATLLKTLSELSFGFSDSDFLNSDDAKKRLLEDEKEFTLQNIDPNFTACSSWVPMTSKKSCELLLGKDTQVLREKLYTSIGEYIQIRSEPIASSSADANDRKTYFGRDASTPTPPSVKNGESQAHIGFGASTPLPAKGHFDFQASTPLPAKGHFDFQASTLVAANIETSNIDTKIKDYRFPLDSSISGEPLTTKFLYSVTPKTKNADFTNHFHYYVGDTWFKHAQRLKANEEMNKWRNNLPRNSSQYTDSEADTIIKFMHGYSSKYLKELASSPISDQSTIRKRLGNDTSSIVEQWYVQPEEMILDTKKGNRVLLINNSTKELKFRIKFPVNILSVSPFSGTVHAKGQIGLRIQVIHSPLRPIENIEEDIKIISRKCEKILHVKIFKEQQKSKIVKERSFIVF